jgi:hypothetical protein
MVEGFHLPARMLQELMQNESGSQLTPQSSGVLALQGLAVEVNNEDRQPVVTLAASMRSRSNASVTPSWRQHNPLHRPRGHHSRVSRMASDRHKSNHHATATVGARLDGGVDFFVRRKVDLAREQRIARSPRGTSPFRRRVGASAHAISASTCAALAHAHLSVGLLRNLDAAVPAHRNRKAPALLPSSGESTFIGSRAYRARLAIQSGRSGIHRACSTCPRRWFKRLKSQKPLRLTLAPLLEHT